MSELLQVMKRAAVEAVRESNPTAVLTGTVTKTAPLEVSVGQQLPLTKEFLVVPESLTDRTVKVSLSWMTGMGGAPVHAHDLQGTQTMTIYAGLRAGDRVLLLRMQGGQKYLILDRVVM